MKIALPLIVIPALIVLFLPTGVLSTYTTVVESLALFIGSLLSLLVALTYRKELRAVFIFLSAFLFIYTLAIILLPYFESRTGEYFKGILLGTQVINYAMLIFCCINILKVVDIRQLNRNGWIIFGITVAAALFLAIYPKFPQYQHYLNQEWSMVQYLVIRIFDAVLIIALIPVVWLYVQYLKSRQQQSLTFTIIIFGVVCCTLFDYIFQSVVAGFPQLLAQGSPLYDTIPEVLFIYGYLVIAVGLYAHRKQDEWGFKAIERALG